MQDRSCVQIVNRPPLVAAGVLGVARGLINIPRGPWPASSDDKADEGGLQGAEGRGPECRQ